uniref:Uncharacterized protein n=1 Tax=Opuntia streptacantha TaxID=393608 RepID=A0A7C9D9M0_OPUST
MSLSPRMAKLAFWAPFKSAFLHSFPRALLELTRRVTPLNSPTPASSCLINGLPFNFYLPYTSLLFNHLLRFSYTLSHTHFGWLKGTMKNSPISLPKREKKLSNGRKLSMG